MILAGRAEFIERYFETVAELLARGFAVVALDWRGQGMSERQLGNSRKGHIDDFEIYERDLVALRDQILTPLCPKPWFALGHSMGAAVLLAQAHAGRSPFARLVLTSPMIDLYLLRFKAGARLFIEGLDIIGLGGSYIPGASGRSIYLRPFAQQVLTSDRNAPWRALSRRSVPPRNLPSAVPTVSWANAALRLMRQFEKSRLCAQDADTGARDCHRAPTGLSQRRRSKPLRAVSRPAISLPLPQARHDILMERNVFRSQFWAAFDAFIPGAEDEIAKTLRAAPPRRRRRGLLRWPLAARV
ncbi:MAG: alpha/beta hydrolase [Methylovirgula sp.]